ncbi:MAG: hypothetical protein NDJ89_10085 [Oligoflexia bacterium]|nr:hypothetical protein [Oligoflexia bacterium]
MKFYAAFTMPMIAGLMSVTFVHASGTVISMREVLLPIDISTTRIKLSRADYMAPVVKVLVPELADVTLLDHRNTGEGAPCLATYEATAPEEVIQGRPAIEEARFTVTLKKQAELEPRTSTCSIHLIEEIHGKIRGFAFEHSRTARIGSRHPDDCN